VASRWRLTRQAVAVVIRVGGSNETLCVASGTHFHHRHVSFCLAEQACGQQQQGVFDSLSPGEK